MRTPRLLLLAFSLQPHIPLPSPRRLPVTPYVLCTALSPPYDVYNPQDVFGVYEASRTGPDSSLLHEAHTDDVGRAYNILSTPASDGEGSDIGVGLYRGREEWKMR